jgi:hypothetical protein
MLTRSILLATFVVSLFSLNRAAQAQSALQFPKEFPGAPYYARITRNFVVHTDEWAAVIFYREPVCVPLNFNLLDFFNPPAAFSCLLTGDGFALFDQVPPQTNLPPREAKTFGRGAVPIAFVRWHELQAAMADGVLTIGELYALPSLRVVTATHFVETLKPTPLAGMGGSQHPMLTVEAGGEGFFLQVSAHGDPLILKRVVLHFN